MKKFTSSALLAVSTLIVIYYVLKKLNIIFVVHLTFPQLLALIAGAILIVYLFLVFAGKNIKS